MLFFTFIKGVGHPPTGPLDLNGFSSIIRGGDVGRQPSPIFVFINVLINVIIEEL